MATKSTRNSKLPKCSLVAIYTNVNKGTRGTKFFTNESGAFTVTFGCKQPKTRTYPFQVQYRATWRYTAATAQAKGANWTGWQGWKNAIAVSGIAFDATTNPDTWLKSNKGVNKKCDYMSLFKLENKSLGGYSAVCYQVRIRSYDAKNKKHGDWITSDKLYICRRCEVVDEALRATEDGGLSLEFNYKWDRGGTVKVTSVKDSTGRELLEGTYEVAPAFDSYRTSGTIPATRSGYTPGIVTIPPEYLKRAPVYQEQLAYTASYVTKDGAPTPLTTPLTVLSADVSLDPPVPVPTVDADKALVTVTVYKGDADDNYSGVGCTATYTYNGKAYTVNPLTSSTTMGVTTTTDPIGTFGFRDVPLNTELTFTATIKNGKDSNAGTATATVDVGNLMYLNDLTKADTDNVATAFGDMELSLATKGEYTIDKPFGRSLPFVAYGVGITTEVSLTATVYERDEDAATPTDTRATFRRWNTVRTTPAVYMLRMPDGQMYRVAVKSVSLSQTKVGYRRLSLSAEEVI